MGGKRADLQPIMAGLLLLHCRAGAGMQLLLESPAPSGPRTLLMHSSACCPSSCPQRQWRQWPDTLQTHPLLPGQAPGRWLRLARGCRIPSLSGLLLYKKMVWGGEAGCAGVRSVAWRRKLWHQLSFQEKYDFNLTITYFCQKT